MVADANEKTSRTGNCDSHALDRKSTRLNSSHSQISYAVFCLKKKKNSSDHIGRAHVLTPVTVKSSMQSSSRKKESYTAELNSQPIACEDLILVIETAAECDR